MDGQLHGGGVEAAAAVADEGPAAAAEEEGPAAAAHVPAPL